MLQYKINFDEGRLCEADFCEYIAEVVAPLITSDESTNKFINCLRDCILVSNYLNILQTGYCIV